MELWAALTLDCVDNCSCDEMESAHLGTKGQLPRKHHIVSHRCPVQDRCNWNREGIRDRHRWLNPFSCRRFEMFHPDKSRQCHVSDDDSTPHRYWIPHGSLSS